MSLYKVTPRLKLFQAGGSDDRVTFFLNKRLKSLAQVIFISHVVYNSSFYFLKECFMIILRLKSRSIYCRCLCPSRCVISYVI